VTVNISLSAKRTVRKPQVLWYTNAEESVHFGLCDNIMSLIGGGGGRVAQRRCCHAAAAASALVGGERPAACRVEAANDNYIIAYVEKGEKKPSSTVSRA